MSVLPKIHGKQIETRDFPRLTWNADLISYDGPLLTLYRSEDDEDFLAAWLDADKRRNRWAFLPTNRDSLLGYLQEEKSLLEVFQDSVYLYIVDIGSGGRKLSRIKTEWQRIPTEYLPDDSSFLHSSIATWAARDLIQHKAKSYSLGLDGELYLEEIAAIPKLYQQLYSFHYGLAYMERPAVSDKLRQLSKSWRGGISGVNIFTGLASVTPDIHRPRLEELKYNSPGFIKLELLPQLAQEIAAAVKHIESSSTFLLAEDLYVDVYRYFRDQKLSGFDTDHAVNNRVLTPTQKKRISEYIEHFFRVLAWNRSIEQFENLEADTLGQMRILLAYYRRLRRLREFVIQGKLAVP